MPRFPSDGRDPEEVAEELRDKRARDTRFSSGRILGSMCTAPLPEARDAYEAFLETNLGDPALFPGARELERQAQAMLVDLLHGPPTGTATFTSGGTEANFTALRLARERTGNREVVLPETAHFSFDKACDVLELTPRVADVTDGYTVDVDHVRELVGEGTAAVVGVAGTTEFGTVDPIPQLAEVAQEAGVPLHVDAAYGGFVLPFVDDPGLPAFDLGVDGVDTVTVDPHKMGMAPIPAGALVLRDAAHLEAIATPSPYVSTEKQSTLLGTRPGGAPVATWTAMQVLGRTGYADVAARCRRLAGYLAREVERMGGQVALDPPLGVVAIRAPRPEAASIALAERGWHVNLAPLSGGVKVVVMPHVTREALDAFLPELRTVLKHQGGLDG